MRRLRARRAGFGPLQRDWRGREAQASRPRSFSRARVESLGRARRRIGSLGNASSREPRRNGDVAAVDPNPWERPPAVLPGG